MEETNTGFLLTADSYDIADGHRIELFLSTDLGPVCLRFTNQKVVFFVERASQFKLDIPHERRGLDLKTMANKDVDGLYFSKLVHAREASDILKSSKVRTYESDIRHHERFLMERSIYGSLQFKGEQSHSHTLPIYENPHIAPSNYCPRLGWFSLDIETGMKGELYSVAYHYMREKEEVKRVLMVGTPGSETLPYLTLYHHERELLVDFTRELFERDPDLILGWHVIGFDLMFLEKKCREHNVSFDWGRLKGKMKLSERKGAGYFAQTPGRIIIDGPQNLRSNFFQFENYKLETVAQSVLGEGKLIQDEGKDKVQQIEEQFREDKESLAKYNLMDCQLVTQIFEKTQLVDLCIERVKISGLLMARQGVSTAAFDYLFLPQLHRKGLVASNRLDIERVGSSHGGHVFDSEVGLHQHVITLDFKSLYPSIMRTFFIDPYSRLKSDVNTVETPVNIAFSRTEHILPERLEKLFLLREKAKKEHRAPLSQAIKILMNSFYGVMGSPNCRFYHTDLPSAITGTGKWLLITARNFLEDHDYRVLYGDTDSLFVQLKENEVEQAHVSGESIALNLNEYLKRLIKEQFKVDSLLELEFEKYYRKVFFPSIRGKEVGAKKRYVGLIQSADKGTELSFAGMEFVRSDWTKLAKELQYELYRRFFQSEDMVSWLKEMVARLKQGEFDHQLIYKKRMSKDIDEYKKTMPPHVKAALALKEKTGKTPRTIYFKMTRRGPIPVELDTHDLDYEHYIEKQIRPLAEPLFKAIDVDFDSLVGTEQLNLF